MSQSKGRTPLHLAVIEDNSTLVGTLLKKGAKIEKDQWGMTPITLTKLLNRSNSLVKPEDRPILIYRNSDQKIHAMSIKEFEERMNITYLDSLIFEGIDPIDIIAKKCARKLKKKNFDQMNRWTLALHGKEMDRPREHYVYIRWINRYLGYGAYAARDIPSLTYIGEYTGVVKKRKNRKNRFNDYIFSYDLFGRSTRYCIDAKEKGNFTRFLNHSDNPNLTSRGVVKEGTAHIILFSNQLIRKGEQLTYCYGPCYWRSRSIPAPL